MNNQYNEIKKQLYIIVKQYKHDKKMFLKHSKDFVKSFPLNSMEKKEIAFGIIEHSNNELQKFCDILNNDKKLIHLSFEIQSVLIRGNLLILNYIKSKNIFISGYDLLKLIDKSEEYSEEINDLILSLNGHKHIHDINGKIALEIPARHYLKGHLEIKKLVDYWIKEI